MPYIETLDDILEDLANKLYIYGCQYSEEELIDGHPHDCKCRTCWYMEMEDRIRKAIENEKLLYPKPQSA